MIEEIENNFPLIIQFSKFSSLPHLSPEKTKQPRKEKKNTFHPIDPSTLYPNPKLSNPDPRLYSFHCLEF